MAWQPSDQDIANRDTLNALRAQGKTPYDIFFPGGCRGTIGCLFVAIVLGVIASVVGLGISHAMHRHPSVPPPKGQVNRETATLNEGQFYGLSDGGHLSQVGGPGYFLRMTSSGLSFASDVNMIAPPVSAIADTGDPCAGLALATRSDPRSVSWSRFTAGTELCARPQGSHTGYDYVLTMNGFPGQQVMVTVTTWDPSASAAGH